MAYYPLQRNQQPYVDVGGVRYTWDYASGKYKDPQGYALGEPRPAPPPGGAPLPAQSNAPNPSGPGTPLGPNPGNLPTGPPAPTGGPGAPPAPPPPDPYQGWLSSDPGSRSYRYFDETAKEFYDDNPANAWGQFTNDLFGMRDTPMRGYAQSRYNDYYNEYLRASELANGGTMYTDTLTSDLAAKIRQSFAMQSPNQKGYNLMWQPGGRTTF